MDCSVHGILVRILEGVAILFSRRSSWPRDQTWVSWMAGRFFTIWATREADIFCFNKRIFHFKRRILDPQYPRMQIFSLTRQRIIWEWCTVIKEFHGNGFLERNTRSHFGNSVQQEGSPWTCCVICFSPCLSQDGIGTSPCWNWLHTLLKWASCHTNWWVWVQTCQRTRMNIRLG